MHATILSLVPALKKYGSLFRLYSMIVSIGTCLEAGILHHGGTAYEVFIRAFALIQSRLWGFKSSECPKPETPKPESLMSGSVPAPVGKQH